MRKSFFLFLACGIFVSTFAQDPISIISGNWESNWGPVQLNVGKTSISGSWEQGGDGIGQITGGSFNVNTNILSYTYSQPWNNKTGKAKLVFSETATGYKLSGPWQHDDGSGNGTWTLKKIKEIADKPVIDNEKFILTKPNDPDSLPAEGKGRLLQIWGKLVIWLTENGFFSLPPGNGFYDMNPGTFQMSVNEIKVENVPIRTGYSTLIRNDILELRSEIGDNSYWQLWDAIKQTNYKVNFYTAPASVNVPKSKPIAVPVGTYNISIDWVENNTHLRSYYPIRIKGDGITIDISEYAKQTVPNESDFWVMTSTALKTESGGLNLNFPTGVDWEIKVYKKMSKIPIATYSNKLQKKTYPSVLNTNQSLQPGKYDISLCNKLIENVWIQNAQSTRLKAGIINIVSGGDWTLYPDTPGSPAIVSGSTPSKIAIPPVPYRYRLAFAVDPINSFIVYIKDGEIQDFDITGRILSNNN